MDGKIMLLSADNAKIGTTHPRRARQLVKKQRAAWVDERQQALRFYPGMENQAGTVRDELDELLEMREMPERPDTVCTQAPADKAALAAGIGRLSRAQIWFVVHGVISSLLIMGMLFLGVLMGTFGGITAVWLIVGVPAGMLLTGFCVHAYFFFKIMHGGGALRQNARALRNRSAKAARQIADLTKAEFGCDSVFFDNTVGLPYLIFSNPPPY